MREPFDADYRERFDEVYRTNGWGGEESHSISSFGAQEAREDLAPILVEFAEQEDIESVLDIGCGDSVWQPDLPGYIGLDVSEEALAAASERHPERDFRLYTGGSLPRADLVIAKHVIQHMTPDDGVILMDRIKRSKPTWLLATTYSKGINEATHVIDGPGGYWPDLTKAPFGLGRPDRAFRVAHGDEASQERGGYLGLWKLGA
jgi:SAM-dependent methyltransferase